MFHIAFGIILSRVDGRQSQNLAVFLTFWNSNGIIIA